MLDKDGNGVTVREFIERILEEREKANETARKSMELRLDHLNELRAEVQEDRRQYVTRAKYEADIENIQQKLQSIDKRAASQDAVSAYRRLVWAAVGTGVLAFLVALFNLVTKASS